jgi:hypothetical protein
VDGDTEERERDLYTPLLLFMFMFILGGRTKTGAYIVLVHLGAEGVAFFSWDAARSCFFFLGWKGSFNLGVWERAWLARGFLGMRGNCGGEGEEVCDGRGGEKR